MDPSTWSGIEGDEREGRVLIFAFDLTNGSFVESRWWYEPEKDLR